MLFVVGAVFVIWGALLLAPFVSEGLFGMLSGFASALKSPFNVELCSNTLPTVGALLGAYGLAIAIYLSNRKNYRRGEEQGSAQWADPHEVNKRYAEQNNQFANKILTANVRIGLDGRKHRRNLNVMVIGGSGSGKTRFYCKPNLLQCATSYIVLDPKGELVRDTGRLMEEQGYRVIILDLINMDKSHCYNPFVYIKDDNDVFKLATNLFANTSEKGAQKGEQFWNDTAKILLQALIFYLKYEAPPEEQNFGMVMELLSLMNVSEEDESYKSELDMLFDELRAKDPYHIAVQQYDLLMKAAGKTLKSVMITLISHLSKFNLSSLQRLTATDEMKLSSIGEKKTVLYAVVPDNDTSFNFIVGMLYTQLFQELFYQADQVHGGRLPVHVHFVMDEFANVALPDDFDKLLSTMRSREISVSIILQNISQLKALYDKQWESIKGNCDSLLYLGGNEDSTWEMISKRLGKETIDTNTYGKSSGRSGSYSTNYQNAGRELLTPDEIARLNNDLAILFERGELPVLDSKYDVLKHPNVGPTTDGKGKPFTYGSAPRIHDPKEVMVRVGSYDDYELIYGEDAIEAYIDSIPKSA